MCIVVYAVDSHPTYKLILAANRDEYLHRPTSPATWRDAHDLSNEGDDVLCGLDVVAGGTWLGMTKDGRLGVLTNFTEPPPTTPPSSSRGAILASFLAPPSPPAVPGNPSADPPPPTVASPTAFLSGLSPTAQSFAGFNVLLFSLFPTSTSPSPSPAECAYLSNRQASCPPLPLRVDAPVGALSNSLLDDPWEKTGRLGGEVERLLEEERDGGGVEWGEDEWIRKLEGVMSHSVPTTDRSTFRHSTTIPPLLLTTSAPPASPKWYATRLLTIVLITHAGEYTFVEEDVWVLDGSRSGEGQGEVKRGDGRRVYKGILEVDA